MESTSGEGFTFKNILVNYVEYVMNQYRATLHIKEEIEQGYEKSKKEYEEYIEANNLIPQDDVVDENIAESAILQSDKLVLKTSDLKSYNQLVTKIGALSFLSDNILETQFVECITRFDVFLLNFMRKCFYAFPDRFGKQERNIQLSELKELKSIDELKYKIIDDELEKIFRDSHKEQLNYINKAFKIDFMKAAPTLYSSFIEITERRNLYIHCNGQVSTQYIRVCKQENAKPASAQVKEKLPISLDYFIESNGVLLSFAIIIAFSMWLKLSKQDEADACNSVISISNRLLKQNRPQIVIDILNYVISKSKELQIQRKFVNKFYMYLLRAYSKIGDRESFEKILSVADFSDVNQSIQLALVVLQGKYEEAFDLLKEINGNEKVLQKSKLAISEIFTGLILQDNFDKIYQEIYGEEFHIEEDKLSFN